MGSQFVTDPFWGSFGSSTLRDFEAAPGRALSNTHAAEAIVDQRIKRGREKAINDLEIRLGDEMAATLEDQQAKPIETVGPMVGDINNPPPGIPTGSFIDPRDQAAADAETGRRRKIAGEDAIRLAALKGEINQIYPMRGQGHALIAGRPTVLDQFETTGRMPTAEERSTPAVHNLTIAHRDPTTGEMVPTGQVSTNDGKTIFGSGGQPLTSALKNPDDQFLAAGAASDRASNPFKDQGEARQRLSVIDNNIRSHGGQATPEEADLVRKLAPIAYKFVFKETKEGDRMVSKFVPEEEIPPWIGNLLGIAQPATSTTTITPDVGGGGPGDPNLPLDADPGAASLAKLLGLPGSEAPPAEAPKPIIDINKPRVIDEGPIDAEGLRKEYQETKRFKLYDTAAKTWNASVLGTYAGDKAADQALVYGFVKMLDDLTGVRGEETRSAAEIGGVKEWLKSFEGRLTGEGLSPEVRVQIIKTMKRYVDEVVTYGKKNEEFYTNVANQGHLAPKAVLAPLPDLVEFDEAKARRVHNGPTSPAPVPASALPKPEDRIVGDKYPTPQGPMKWTKEGWVQP